MPYYLAQSPILLEQTFELLGDEAFHLVVSSRAKKGEKVILQDTLDKRFLCEVLLVGRKSATLKALKPLALPKKSSLEIKLCTPYLPENTLNTVLTKATELGVSEIIIYKADFCAINLKEKLDQKFERWQKILQSSTQQCMRVSPPKLKIYMSLKELLEETQDMPDRFMFDLENTAPWPDKLKEKTVCVLVGPEGGFSEKELELSKNTQNLQVLSLGGTVLRSETASIAGVLICMGKYGNFA